LAYDAMDPGIYLNDLFERSFLLPYPSGGQEAFLKRLYYIKQNYGLDAVISNLDAELPLIIKYQDELKDKGIHTFVPDAEQFRLRGKDRLEEVAKNIGVKTPPSMVVTSYEDLNEAIEKLGLPLMVKGAFYKAYRAYTSQEAAGYYNKIVAEWGYPVIVQKSVSGEELNVVGAGDGSGRSLGMVGIKKMWITSLGKIWTGVTIKHKAMLDAAKKFLTEYQWKGGFELECIVDGDTVYLIEINPRLPAWSYFATGVGINLPANIIRHMQGRELDIPDDYDAGKLYVRYTWETITEMTAFQNMTTRGENPK